MRGQGKKGHCSICASPLAESINQMIRDGKTTTDIRAFVTAAGQTPWSRPTIYNHKDHALTPEKALVKAVRQELEIKKSSNTEFLEAVRDIGFSKAVSDPESISIDQALKATQILEGRKEKTDNLAILVAFVTGNRPAGVVIEGEAREVTAE